MLGLFSKSKCFFSFVCILLCNLSFADDLIPANPEYQWFKGNLHTHTLWSDGNDFPDMVAEWYRTNDYNFLGLSDHNVLSEGIRWVKASRLKKNALEKYTERFGNDWVETRGEPGTPNHEIRLKPLNEFRSLVDERGKFIMISSEEISDRADGKPVHMNATNLKELIRPHGGKDVREAITGNMRLAEEQAKKFGREILVHLNHPNFGKAITAEDLAAVLTERFFEVYNGHPGVGHLGDKHHPAVEDLWDIANTLRIAQLKSPPLFGVATDDSHNYHGGKVSPGRGWVMVKAKHLTPETIVKAMKRGEFYASSGVNLKSIQYDPKTKKLSIEIEPDGDATFTTDFIGTPVGYDTKTEERKDDKGKVIRSSLKYSQDVGKIFATVKGNKPTYQLTGKELYIRATITSNKHHVNPSHDHQHQQAWTQPVGFEEHLIIEAEETAAKK